MPILYTASIFVCVLAFIHFALFAALIIVNVFISDEEPGKGNKTSVSRILWGSNHYLYLVMCLVNVILLVTGLAGMGKVITTPLS
jgi:hypothetical protein